LIEGSRICFIQSSIHKDYLFWLHDFLYIRGYCSDLKPRLYTRSIKNSDLIYRGYEFNTYTFRSFDWIYKLFYHKGKKIINKEIEYYITPLSLAVWIMDNGGWVKHGVRISTNAFTYSEVELLTQILFRKFGLLTSIQKLTKIHEENVYMYSIYIKSGSIPLLRKIIQPFIHPTMLYKIGL
jgi:ubiquinol-cytochrome c reductase cytochrome b subunit